MFLYIMHEEIESLKSILVIVIAYVFNSKVNVNNRK